MACSTAGLIPDALLGVQGAAFVCLPALGVLGQEEGQGAQPPSLLFPALPTQYPSWYLPRLVEMASLGGWQCPPHLKARNAEASSSSLTDPPPFTRQIGWRSITSSCGWGN